jgi:hypothetical protein
MNSFGLVVGQRLPAQDNRSQFAHLLFGGPPGAGGELLKAPGVDAGTKGSAKLRWMRGLWSS